MVSPNALSPSLPGTIARRSRTWTLLARDDVDVVSVCVPSGLHSEVGIRAAAAGKHLVVEKPLDVSLEAADRLVSAARAAGVVMTVMSQHRFDQGLIELRRLLDDGQLGRLVLGEASTKWYRSQAYYDSAAWRGTWARDGGSLMNQGIHYLDLLLWAMGPVAEVTALYSTQAHQVEVEDAALAVLRFSSGAMGTVVASTAVYPGFAQRLEISGTGGTVVIEDGEISGVRVSAIGSPIGKIDIDAPLEPELARLRRVADIADQLCTNLVRVFSFFIPDGHDPQFYRARVIDRMRALATLAEERGLILAHENEKKIYGDTPDRCADIIVSVGSRALRATFDAANFVQCGVRPHSDAYELLRPYLVYVQIKDALTGTGQVVPAGQGDGQVAETLAALRDSGFDGYLSLEPHLALAETFGGFSGPGEFRLACRALKDLLAELSVPWQ